MDTKSIKLIVRGRVQRVGYRAAVYGLISDKLPEVKGYVKNLGNGDVEIMVIGSAFDLKAAVKYAYKGSFLSKVESVEIIEVHSDFCNEMNNFTIDYN